MSPTIHDYCHVKTRKKSYNTSICKPYLTREEIYRVKKCKKYLCVIPHLRKNLQHTCMPKKISYQNTLHHFSSVIRSEKFLSTPTIIDFEKTCKI